MLNPQQKKAVETTEGRLLLLAGAGSGKTRVITYRIAHLIKKCRIAPENILGLTFTNKAAKEMRERVAKITSQAISKRVTLNTFHSFCLHILRREIHRLGYTSHFSIYDPRDQQRLLTQVIRDTKEDTSVSQALLDISSAHQQGEDVESQISDETTKELYRLLQTAMRAYNAVDFDSLITLTIQLFEKFPEVLKKYQDQYQYIMIDEYQDTNPAQFRLTELLAKKYSNLCVVGDDDQSIYGWRGAQLKNILNFRSDCVIKLEQNYRSTPEILRAANIVIGNNKNRHEKNLWSKNPPGEAVEIFHAPTEADEAQAVVDRMIALREKGLKWKDMAVLYRSNLLSRNFEVTLMNAMWKKDGSFKRGIPYEVYGGLEFSERSEIKDILAYLRVIANSRDTEALLRIVNVPRRGIANATLDALTKEQRKSNQPLWDVLDSISKQLAPPISSRAHAGIRQLVDIIKQARIRFAKPPLHDSLDWLLTKIDYQRAIEEEVKSEKAQLMKWENTQEIINALAQYEEEMKELKQACSLSDFISTTLLANSSPKKEKRAKEDHVTLMTFHSAKGLEFPACFIIGLEDHILPHEKSTLETGVEEERRLFYVGITRAQRFLFLSMARNRKKMGKTIATSPSRFLFEIPKEILKVSSWKIFS